MLEVRGDRVCLDEPALLARPKHDRAAVGDDRRVEDVDRIGIAGNGRLGEHDFGAARGEGRAEGLVLLRQRRDVGLGPPAVLTPCAEPGEGRRPDEDASQRSRHRLPAEQSCRGLRHSVG